MRPSAKYLFTISASYGHIFPAIRVANILQQRGKDVLFVIAREYQSLLEIYGIPNVPVSNTPHPFMATQNWFESETGLAQYRYINEVIEAYGPDIIVTNPLVMASFALGEVHQIPLTVIGYCEYLYPSVNGTYTTKQWRIESVTGYYNQLRYKLDMPYVGTDAADTPLIGQKYLLRTTPGFHTQDSLPGCVEYTGALIWEPQYVNYPLQHFINEQKQHDRPVFYVQIGRLFDDQTIWKNLLRSMGRMPAAFVIDYARADYMREHSEYADNLFLNGFVPLGYLREQIDGVICSGQTTVVVASIFYGKPILALPNSADGKEVTSRIQQERIGAGTMNIEEMDDYDDLIGDFISEVKKEAYHHCLLPLMRQFHTYDHDDVLYQKIATA